MRPAPVSQPLLTLSPGPTGLAVGDVVQLFCVALKGSPPILYSFYLDGKMLGSPQAPRGRTASFSFTAMSARDAGSYSCQAQNNVSKETSEPKMLSLDGRSCRPAGLCAPASGRSQGSPLGVPPTRTLRCKTERRPCLGRPCPEPGGKVGGRCGGRGGAEPSCWHPLQPPASSLRPHVPQCRPF